jgi:hypothetical protein
MGLRRLAALRRRRYAAGSLFAHTCARWRGLGTAASAAALRIARPLATAWNLG